VKANRKRWGTGAINIDASHVPFADEADETEAKGKNRHADFGSGPRENRVFGDDRRARSDSGNYDPPGRWPPNVALDAQAAATLDEDVGARAPGPRPGTRRSRVDAVAVELRYGKPGIVPVSGDSARRTQLPPDREADRAHGLADPNGDAG